MRKIDSACTVRIGLFKQNLLKFEWGYERAKEEKSKERGMIWSWWKLKFKENGWRKD